MRRITLPDGGWAELRESADLKVRHRHLLEAASVAATPAMRKLPDDLPTDPVAIAALDMGEILAKGALTFEEAHTLERLQEAVVVAFTAGWSLKDPLPTMDTVGDMATDLYDAIAEATRGEGAKAVKDIAFEPSPENVPGDPTGRDSGSNGHSLARESAPLIPPSPVTTASGSSAG